MTDTTESEIRPEDFDPETGAYNGPDNASDADTLQVSNGLEELVLGQGEKIIELSNSLDSLYEKTGASIQQIAESMAENNAALKSLTSKPPATKPDEWNWKHLSGPQAAELLDKVRDWVDWYNGRYAMSDSTRILGCWYRHPVVVEEITALWVAWRAAYYGHQKPDTAATYWHSAYLWPTLKRLWDASWGFKNCGAGHKTTPAKEYVSTDNEYLAIREALAKSQKTPVIPWPGTNPTQAAEPPKTQSLPAVRIP